MVSSGCPSPVLGISANIIPVGSWETFAFLAYFIFTLGRQGTDRIPGTTFIEALNPFINWESWWCSKSTSYNYFHIIKNFNVCIWDKRALKSHQGYCPQELNEGISPAPMFISVTTSSHLGMIRDHHITIASHVAYHINYLMPIAPQNKILPNIYDWRDYD